MAIKVQKWGNSYGVRIPKYIVDQLDLENKEVSMSVEKQEIIIKKIRKSAVPKYTLAELVAQITPENIHEEIDWGPDVGDEIVAWEEK